MTDIRSLAKQLNDIIMPSSAVSNADSTLLAKLGGSKLLITFTFVGTAVLFFVLWAKRQILRMFLISKKGPNTNIGSDAPKVLKREIEESFRSIANMSMEARLLCDQGQRDCGSMTTFIERRDESTYIHRMKAYDLMNCLDDLLCRANFCLARKPRQTVRNHLEMLQQQPFAPFKGEEELCQRVADAYDHARYGMKDFDQKDFALFAKDVGELSHKVHQRLLVPGSLVVPADTEEGLIERQESSVECHSQMIATTLPGARSVTIKTTSNIDEANEPLL